LLGPWRDAQAEEHEEGLVEPQDILVVPPADAHANLPVGYISPTMPRHHTARYGHAILPDRMTDAQDRAF